MSPKMNGTETRKCPVCECDLKRKNYSSHLQRVHGMASSETEPRLGATNKGNRSEKRKLELARRKRTRRFSAAAVILVVLLVGAAFYFTSRDNTTGPSAVQTPPPQTQSTVKISVSQLSSKAQFYSYNSQGTTMRYFAAIGSDSAVHVALDACDVCYAQKKGYTQVGDVMKCNNCGKEFSIDKIGTENLSGGCWPSYVPVTLSGSDAVIELSDLNAKSYMFR